MEPSSELADQVQKALVAHGAWKVRLAQAIEANWSEFSPDVACRDDQCPLGKWLYTEIDPSLRGDDYEKVRKLHAEFHVAAAGVLRLALEGRKTEAQAAMLTPDGFGRASTRLTIALDAWRTTAQS